MMLGVKRVQWVLRPQLTKGASAGMAGVVNLAVKSSDKVSWGAKELSLSMSKDPSHPHHFRPIAFGERIQTKSTNLQENHRSVAADA